VLISVINHFSFKKLKIRSFMDLRFFMAGKWPSPFKHSAAIKLGIISFARGIIFSAGKNMSFSPARTSVGAV
jgi:hypothetical protein